MLPERGLLSGVIITAWSLGPNTQMLSLPPQTGGLSDPYSYVELPLPHNLPGLASKTDQAVRDRLPLRIWSKTRRTSLLQVHLMQLVFQYPHSNCA